MCNVMFLKLCAACLALCVGTVNGAKSAARSISVKPTGQLNERKKRSVVQKGHVEAKNEESALQISGAAIRRALSRKESALQISGAAIRRTLQPTSQAQIPEQLICTGKPDSFSEVDIPEQQNINHTLSLNSGFELRYLGDKACLSYLKKYFSQTGLAEHYEKEKAGMFRGDICRAAVLAREGGVYTDLDVVLEVPISKLINGTATFTTVLSVTPTEILNAVMVATPDHPVMWFMLTRIADWYLNPEPYSKKGLLGTRAAFSALQDMQEQNCPEVELTHVHSNVACGEETIRLLKENLCGNQCPPERVHSSATQFGIYDESNHLHGWSRYASCKDYGCHGTGHDGFNPAALLGEGSSETNFLFDSFSSHKSQILLTGGS